MRSAQRFRSEIFRTMAEKRALVFLDFDGTLAAISPTPEKARLDAQTAEALHALIGAPRARVVILSGRPLGFLLRHFDDPRIFYGGNHGLEIRGPELRFRHPRAVALQSRISTFARRAAAALAEIPGAIVENKGLTMSVHFRSVPVGRRPQFQKKFALFRDETFSVSFRWRRGKMVWELLPALDWNKGRAAERIRRLLRPHVTVAIGDDLTDEDLFRTLKSRGPTVRVGHNRGSAAAYYLPRQRDVPVFLRQLSEALR